MTDKQTIIDKWNELDAKIQAGELTSEQLAELEKRLDEIEAAIWAADQPETESNEG